MGKKSLRVQSAEGSKGSKKILKGVTMQTSFVNSAPPTSYSASANFFKNSATGTKKLRYSSVTRYRNIGRKLLNFVCRNNLRWTKELIAAMSQVG